MSEGAIRLGPGQDGLADGPELPSVFYNLKANPNITIQAEGETRTYRAHQVLPEKKAELWPTITEAYPPYDAYQARTDRDIPVFICDPV